MRYWAGVNTPVLAEDGSVKYILNQPSDITQMVQLRDKNISPLLGVEFTPEQFDQQIGIFEMANKAYIDVFAQSDVIGKPLIDAIPKVE